LEEEEEEEEQKEEVGAHQGKISEPNTSWEKRKRPSLS